MSVLGFIQGFTLFIILGIHIGFTLTKKKILKCFNKEYKLPGRVYSTSNLALMILGLNPKYIYLIPSLIIEHKNVDTGNTLLHECILRDAPNEIIKYILKFDKVKKIINDTNGDDKKPTDLLLNGRFTNFDMLEIFLNAGGQVNMYEFFNKNHYYTIEWNFNLDGEWGLNEKPVINDDVRLFKLLAEYHDVNEPRQISGARPLHMAVKCNNLEIFKILLDNGADMDIETDNGRKPFDYVTPSTNPEIRKILKAHDNIKYVNYLKQHFCNDLVNYTIQYC